MIEAYLAIAAEVGQEPNRCEAVVDAVKKRDGAFWRARHLLSAVEALALSLRLQIATNGEKPEASVLVEQFVEDVMRRTRT